MHIIFLQVFVQVVIPMIIIFLICVTITRARVSLQFFMPLIREVKKLQSTYG